MAKSDKHNFGLVLLWFLLISMYSYRTIYFRRLFNCSPLLSKIVLWGWVISFCALNYFVIDAKQHTGVTTLATLLFPYEVYAILTYFQYYRTFTMVLLCLAGVITCIFVFTIWARPFQENRRTSLILQRRANRSFIYLRNIFSFAFLPFLAVIFLTILRGGNLMVPNVNIVRDGTSAVDTLYDNLDSLYKLNEDEWVELSNQEKINLLQTVINIECNGLGIYHDVAIQGIIPSDESVLGEYDPVNQVIAVNIDHVREGSPKEVLNTVIHECYHAYQWCLVYLYTDSDEKYHNLYLFSDANRYLNDFSNYQNGSDDFEDFKAYYTQAVEGAARTYAANAVEGYYSLIEPSQ